MVRAMLRFGVFVLGAAVLSQMGCGEIRVASVDRGKVGTFFFFWHDCERNAGPTRDYPFTFGPGEQCPQDEFAYHPPAMAGFETFPYTARSRDWYVDELQKMKLAGIDYVFPVYWGDHPTLTFFNTQSVAMLVAAIDLIGSDLKLGLFDDTSSEVSQWNWDNGRGYETKPAMNIADPVVWPYFYEKKVRPYFETVPRRLWATHNGASVEEGGRPIIVTWIAKADAQNPNGPSFFEYHGAAASLWHRTKERFREDFGVEPFVVFESSWYHEADDLDGEGDAQYSWGAAAFHSIWHERKGYVISSVGPGYDDHLVRKSTARVRPRNVTHGADGGERTGDSLAFFRNEYLLNEGIPGWSNHGVRPDSDLILVETWNELYEGSGIEPMVDWPDLERPGQRLNPEAYIRALRELKKERPGLADYDHTIIGSHRNANGSWTLTIRNDGTLTWKKGSVQLGYRIHDRSGKRLKDAVLADLPEDVPFDSRVDLTFSQPGDWTDLGRFRDAAILIDMKVDGNWFTDLGDGYLIRAVAPAFQGFF